MQPFSNESMGAGWSMMVNLIAVTTVLRARGEPVKKQTRVIFFFWFKKNLM